MRNPQTYRAHRRNALRGGLYIGPGAINNEVQFETPGEAFRMWRLGEYALQANTRADIAGRQELCNAAREAVAKAMVNAKRTGTVHDVRAALRDFWGKQKRTRVQCRILKELGPAVPQR